MKKITKSFFSIITLFTLILSILLPTTIKAQERPEKLNIAIVQLITHHSLDRIVEGIHTELEAEGYKEGDNLTIDFHNAEGDLNLLTTISEQVVAKNPDIIFAVTTPVVQAFQNKTKDIPIVFCGVTDPIDANVVDNLEKPGQNITGTSDAPPLEPHFELMKEFMPEMKKIGMIYTTSEDSALVEIEDAKKLAEEKFGLEVQIEGIANSMDMQLVGQKLAGKVDAIYVPSDNIIASSFDTLIDETDRAKIPVFPIVDQMVQQGGVAASAISQESLGTEGVKIAMRVLDGEKIGDIPVKFIEDTKFVYNSKACDLLGIKVPEKLKDKLEDLGGN